MSRRFLIAIWGVLLALLMVSLYFGTLGNVVLATILIFLVATIKAFLVAAFYMRLKWEAGYIVGFLLGGIGLMVVLFVALFPDIVMY